MIRTLFLSSLVSVTTLLATPSSIDAIGLPVAPASRFETEKIEKVDPDAEVWYSLEHVYAYEGEKVRHGLWIQRSRSRDRERYRTDFVEIRRMYYEGEGAEHEVVSTWIDGVLRKREYKLSDELMITLEFNASGQPMRGPRQNARGGRAKRERITNVFDEVYKINHNE
ncbi:MAG: hypothetical protein PF795_13390 [Kiritimatiellae bacterium]|jgi:hypothetical protein|nr:hypothetical protein [Kiritimatiellia bacterium]